VNGLAIVLRPNGGVNERELEQRLTALLRNPEIAMVRSDSTTVAQFGGVLASNGPGVKSKEAQIAVRLVGVSLIVLIIACANVVNLLLARAVRRRREIAVRLALGVSRSRLIRLLLAESAVIAALAAVIAVAVAYWGGSLLRTLLMPDTHWARGPLDWRVVLLALATAIVAGLLAGLIPAIQSASPELTSALKIGAGTEAIQHSRLRASLVVAQSALSVLLLVGAMLFVKSLSNVQHLDIGYDAASTVTLSVRYDDRTRGSDSTVKPRMIELADRLRRVRGVEATALTTLPPMGGFSWITIFAGIDSIASPGFFPTVTGVTHGFFAATGIRILRGEDFAARGSATPPTVIVNQAFAKTVWPGRNPLEQCLRFGARTQPCLRVSALVENARRGEVIEKEEAAQYYISLDNLPDSAKDMRPNYVALRVSPAHFAAASREIRSNVRAVFPGGIPVITRLSDYIDPQYRPWRLGAMLFSALGLLALIVAVVGIYSTVSYGVNQRIHEFGVRIALGARMQDVLRLVVGAGVRTVAVGILIGIALALIAGRLISTLLYGIAPRDPVVLGTVTTTLLVISILAALAPAWRASRVDPVTALRAD
jgi:predicted permease